MFEPPTDTHPLSTFLRDRDAPCPRCTYNLRGLTGGVCPECGESLRLQVGLVEPKLAPFLTTLLALGIGFGASFFLSLVALIAAGPRWWRDTFAAWFALLLIVVSLTGLALVLVFRRNLRRRKTMTQWVVGGLSWAITLGLLALIIATFDD